MSGKYIAKTEVMTGRQIKTMTSSLLRLYGANRKKVAVAAEEAIVRRKTPLFARLGAVSIPECYKIMDLVGGLKSPEENFTLLFGLTDYVACECALLGLCTPSDGLLFSEQDPYIFLSELASVWKRFLSPAQSDLVAESFYSLVSCLADSLCLMEERSVNIQAFKDVVDMLRVLLPSSKRHLISRICTSNLDGTLEVAKRKRRPSTKNYQAPVLLHQKYKDLRSSEQGRLRRPGCYNHLRRMNQQTVDREALKINLESKDDSGSEWDLDSSDLSSMSSSRSSSPGFSSCDDSWFPWGDDGSEDNHATSHKDVFQSDVKTARFGIGGEEEKLPLHSSGCHTGSASPRAAVGASTGQVHTGVPSSTSRLESHQHSPALPYKTTENTVQQFSPPSCANTTSGLAGTERKRGKETPLVDSGERFIIVKPSSEWISSTYSNVKPLPTVDLKQTYGNRSYHVMFAHQEQNSKLSLKETHDQSNFAPMKVLSFENCTGKRVSSLPVQVRPVASLQDITNVHTLPGAATNQVTGSQPVTASSPARPSMTSRLGTGDQAATSDFTTRSLLMAPRTPDGNRNAFKMMMDSSKETTKGGRKRSRRY
ncbi:uncharacterized protein [Ptychodera flava]|uniref:uncharacterized protein n=1 Tax=Ptychodera flava TaxID=63121 RepID=UPI003969F788